jgi:glutaredoxin
MRKYFCDFCKKEVNFWDLKEIDINFEETNLDGEFCRKCLERLKSRIGDFLT